MAFTSLSDSAVDFTALADELSGQASTLKQNFNTHFNEIQTYINTTLIGELSATTDGGSGADNIGATAIAGRAGTTIQALLESIASPPSCRVTNSAAISVADSTWTLLTFDTEAFDASAMHSTTTNPGRLTVAADTQGNYRIEANVSFASNATGYRGIQIKKGTTVIAQQIVPAVNGAVTVLALPTMINAVAGDYFTVEAFQTSTGALNVTTDALSFSALKVS